MTSDIYIILEGGGGGGGGGGGEVAKIPAQLALADTLLRMVHK